MKRLWFVPAIMVMCAAAASARAQVIVTHDFTTGSNNGYAFDPPSGGVAWKVGVPPSALGTTTCLCCNNGADYVGDTSLISASSPMIDPAGNTSLTITVNCDFETETERPGQENNYDVRWMTVTQGSTTLFYQFLNPAGPSTPLVAGDNISVCGSAGTWHTHSIPVTLSSAAPIQIAFGFWTIDNLYNNHAGWAIRKVQVLGSASSGGGNGPGGGFEPYRKQSCGMVGIDGLVVLAVIEVIRRRRSRRSRCAE